MSTVGAVKSSTKDGHSEISCVGKILDDAKKNVDECL